MRNEHYPHIIAAIYRDAQSADVASVALEAAKLGDVELVHLHADSPHLARSIEHQQAKTRSRFIQDILIGTGIGMAIGAASAGIIALALPSLFVGVPVVGPLMLAGYGTSLGMTAGAIKALKVKKGFLSGVMQDAIKAGFHIVIVHSADAATHARAEAVVDTTRCQRGYRHHLNALREHAHRAQLDRRLPPAGWLDRRFRLNGWLTWQVGIESDRGVHR